jgi:hypothetical protein
VRCGDLEGLDAATSGGHLDFALLERANRFVAGRQGAADLAAVCHDCAWTTPETTSDAARAALEAHTCLT